jgi:hypothetical protein
VETPFEFEHLGSRMTKGFPPLNQHTSLPQQTGWGFLLTQDALFANYLFARGVHVMNFLKVDWYTQRNVIPMGVC